MSTNTSPDSGLHIDILQTLERLRIPYVIIGAFAATIYGISRPTYDIDIIVDLSEKHIEGLVRAYPPPRFYADPVQIRESIRLGFFTFIPRNLWINAVLHDGQNDWGQRPIACGRTFNPPLVGKSSVYENATTGIHSDRKRRS